MVGSWRDRAWEAFRSLAASGEDFTADDLRDLVGEPDVLHRANGRNNGIGSIFREAAAKGLIVDTGRHVKSRSPHRKGGTIAVWRGAVVADRLF